MRKCKHHCHGNRIATINVKPNCCFKIERPLLHIAQANRPLQLKAVSIGSGRISKWKWLSGRTEFSHKSCQWKKKHTHTHTKQSKV